MVQPIVKDPVFLAMKSEAASRGDEGIGADLADTLRANRERCVGLAANMIGKRRRVIAVMAGLVPMVMYNPRILSAEEPYEAEEGCLSLPGTRRTRRFRRITVAFEGPDRRPVTRSFEGELAQIIQHECDHLEGILI